ncbi:hypothetical protein BDF19DRAFT_419370 [Syncephalis fuscata]|nr:hypothetical protein BDF19DRAFT_419370 [Syncephalis fuscata]
MQLTSLLAVLFVLPALTLGLPSPQGPSKEDIRNGKPGVKARFDGQQVVSLTAGDRIPQNVWDQVEQLHLDVWKQTTTELHVRVDPSERIALAALPNVKLTTIVDDVQKLIDSEKANKNSFAPEKYGSPTWFNNYHELTELTNWYYDLAKQHSDIVTTPVVIGNTIENRPLLKFTITGPGDASGRKLEFVIVPVCNPDGYVFTWSSNRLWRKNREGIQNGRTYGVDINRNWPDHWGARGSSTNPSAEDYRGPSAGSTREVQALTTAYIKTPNIVSAVDLHSYSQLVLRSYGWTTAIPQDESRLAKVGQQFADDIRAQSGKEYTSQRSVELYVTSGEVTDWWYGEALNQKKKAGVPAPRPYAFCMNYDRPILLAAKALFYRQVK